MLVESPIFNEMSGKLGGGVGSKNKGGQNWHVRRKCSNPQSQAQLSVRAQLAQLSRNWGNLTLSQREQWNAAALNFPYKNRIGQTKYLSGEAFYVKCNMNIWSIGGTAIDSPPFMSAVLGIAEITSLAASAGGGTLAMGFAGSPTDAGTSHLVMASRGMSPGRMSDKVSYRVIGVLAGGVTTPQALGAMYTNEFGAMIETSKIFIQLVPIEDSTGIAGVPVKSSVIVGA